MNVEELCERFGIGLTGGIATGKSTVANMILKHGYIVIDADVLSRLVMSPGTTEYVAILSLLGDVKQSESPELDRARIRDLIFSDQALKRDFEKIVHRGIRERLGEELAAAGLLASPRPWFYEAALLYEANRAAEFSAIWATVCDEKTQLERLMARDHIDANTARSFLANQMPAREKAGRADVVIDTDVSMADLSARVEAAIDSLAK